MDVEPRVSLELILGICLMLGAWTGYAAGRVHAAIRYDRKTRMKAKSLQPQNVQSERPTRRPWYTSPPRESHQERDLRN